MVSKCFGPLQVKQFGPVQEVELEKKYDLCLVTLSWEQRATFAFLKEGGNIESATAIWFESTSVEIDERKAGQISTLRTKIGDVDELRLNRATEVDVNFQKLKGFVEEKFREIGRPLKVLIDISCVPKNYILFLIGIGFTQDFFACFDCVYSAGSYDLMSEGEAASDEAGRIHRALTSSGKWTSRQIPFLAAESAFPDTRDLIVAMGGEIGLALPMVAKIEPNRLSLIFIDETAPGESGNALDGEMQAYRSLINDYGAEDYRFPLGDVIGVAEYLEKVCSESTADCVSLLVLGTKSHAVAAGVIGLSFDDLEVICRVPTSYLTLDVAPSGDIYFYALEDRFEPSNYLSM